MPKRIYLKDIYRLDDELDTAFIRELEMVLEYYAVEPGVVLQFFEDLRIYGLDEAIAYVQSYVDEGYYRPEVMDRIRDIQRRIKEAIERTRPRPMSGGSGDPSKRHVWYSEGFREGQKAAMDALADREARAELERYVAEGRLKEYIDHVALRIEVGIERRTERYEAWLEGFIDGFSRTVLEELQYIS